MFLKNWKKEILSIPNLLSLFRLVLIPVYVLLYLEKDYFLAAAILAVSCLTDMIDGKIARRFNMITTLGKIIDPLADKVTQFTLILCLALRYPFIWYLVGLFVVKESFQLIAGSLRLRKGVMLKGALITGKVCTTILFLSLIVMVLIPELEEKVVNIIVIVDIVFMLIAFADYILAYFKNDSKFQSIQEPTDDA